MPKPRQSKRTAVGRPDRLKIKFQDLDPSYKLFSKGTCTKADLLIAGFAAENANALVWNSYSNTAMEHTLIRPEEWFWTDRQWWKSETDAPHIEAMYRVSGGSFTDLSPSEQAALLQAPFKAQTGRKARGNLWRTPEAQDVDIVRYMRLRLIEEGYDMAPAYPENINLLVCNYASDRLGKDIRFISAGSSQCDEQRRTALTAIDEIVRDPGSEWDRKPDYYFRFLNGFRATKDFDRSALLATCDIVGSFEYSQILKHFWLHQTYENQMTPPTLPPLAGRLNGQLNFFFVTQKASFRSNVSMFVRDYARPLGLAVTLIQLSDEAKP